MDYDLDNALELKNLAKKVRQALNNEKVYWNKKSLFTDFKYLRYLSTLCWISLDPNYNEKGYSLYKIKQAGTLLGLNLEKSKRAYPIYAELIKRKEISHHKESAVTCYFITEKGMRLCKDRLISLDSIVNDLKEICNLDNSSGKGGKLPDMPKEVLRKIQKISRELLKN